jgi:hypothetical protein
VRASTPFTILCHAGRGNQLWSSRLIFRHVALGVLLFHRGSAAARRGYLQRAISMLMRKTDDVAFAVDMVRTACSLGVCLIICVRAQVHPPWHALVMLIHHCVSHFSQGPAAFMEHFHAFMTSSPGAFLNSNAGPLKLLDAASVMQHWL